MKLFSVSNSSGKTRSVQHRSSFRNAADKYQSESSSSSCDSEEDEELSRKVNHEIINSRY